MNENPALQRHTKKSVKTVVLVLTFFLLVSVVILTGLGPVRVPFTQVLKIIAAPVIGNTGQFSSLEYSIVWTLRLPRVLLGMVVGACLAVTGVVMQALVRNHLADPFVLGVSSGAAAFATFGMLFGAFSFLGTYALSISAFLGSAITIILVYTLSKVKGVFNITHLLLSGIAISMIMDALTKVVTLSAPNALGLHNATFWMSGSLAGAKWAYLTLPLAVMLISMALLMLHHRHLNALVLGDETAAALGVSVKNIQKLLILCASLLAGCTIAVSGVIGFVGLMVPHITRILVGADHKKVLPVCALIGALLVSWVDMIARMVIAPEELPVGILTALIGGPFFIWLLKRKKEG